MADFRSFNYKHGRKGSGHNRNNRTARSDRRLLLDKGRDKLFLLDLNEALANLKNKEAVGSLRGNIYVKANSMGINDAKEYLSRMETEKVITQDEFRLISVVLDRYGRWR